MVFKKGRSPHNKGVTGVVIVSSETRKKLSNSHKGFKFSNESKEKMRKSAFERMEKYPNTIPDFTNHKHSSESKTKMSEKAKGKHFSPKTEFKKGQVAHNKGTKGVIKQSDEQKEKMSEIAKERGFGKWMIGRIPHNKGKIFFSTKICEYCKKEFTIRGKKPALVKKYCSRKCSGQDKIGKASPLKGIPRTEEVKKKIGESNKGHIPTVEVRKKMSDIKKGKHISPNTEFKNGSIPPSSAFKIKDPRLVGKNNCNWKGGITEESQRIRCSIEYSIWRSAVFARDGYIDQKTGIKGEKLVAHHILNFSSYPELRVAIDNGITFSIKSHLEFHNRYGRKNNTKEQLEEFLLDNN